MTAAIINARIFDGESLLRDHAVLLSQGKIAELLPEQQLPQGMDMITDLNGDYLLPGFIDLQVNGGGGLLFNAEPEVDTIRAIGEAHRQYGTTGFLPTLITDDFDVMRKAILAVSDAIEQDVPGVLGIHLEGPFLNAQRKGTHDPHKFRVMDETGFQMINSLKQGKTLITLAPELTTAAMISRISRAGIIVCAGHTAANYEQTQQALNAGLHGFTHLYNAMSPMNSREPGVVGAALADERSWFGIIADGIHVHPAALKVAVKAKQRGGALLVTDAMPTVGAEDKVFELNGEIIRAKNGSLYNAQGSLAGSDLDMITAVRNAAEYAQLDWLEAVRMASLYPAQALGLDHQLGYIKPGYQANFVAVNGQYQVTQTWINGHSSARN